MTTEICTDVTPCHGEQRFALTDFYRKGAWRLPTSFANANSLRVGGEFESFLRDKAPDRRTYAF